jgi:hypothetical protein
VYNSPAFLCQTAAGKFGGFVVAVEPIADCGVMGRAVIGGGGCRGGGAVIGGGGYGGGDGGCGCGAGGGGGDSKGGTGEPSVYIS